MLDLIHTFQGFFHFLDALALGSISIKPLEISTRLKKTLVREHEPRCPKIKRNPFTLYLNLTLFKELSRNLKINKE